MARRVILKDKKTLETLHPRTEVASVEGLQTALDSEKSAREEALASMREELNGKQEKFINGLVVKLEQNGSSKIINLKNELDGLVNTIITSEDPYSGWTIGGDNKLATIALIKKKIAEAVFGFVTRSVDDLVNYYTKNESYSKTEITQLLAAIKQFTYESVATLPTAAASTTNKIYLVPSKNSQQNNVRDEYITILDGGSYKWEQIGSTAINLEGYLKDSDIAAWAKAASKPSYTAQEVGALPATTAIPTKVSQLTNDSGFTTNTGTITGITMNGASKGTSGVVNLGTVLTEHQSLAGKQDVISDLATIRSGASAGATAYQKPSTGIPSTDLALAVQTSLVYADEDTVRSYNTQSPNGMGYLVLDKDATFASQVTAANTIYEIRYDFILSANFNMPSNCVLKFNGGSVSGAYSLTGANTKIEAGLVKIFGADTIISGTWNINEAYPEWFGAKGDDSVDDAIFINACITSFNKALLTKQNYYTTQTIALKAKSVLASRTKDTTVNYKGTTDCVRFAKAATESIVRNIAFVGNYNTFATDNTFGLHFNETEVGRGILLENLSIAAFNTGIKAKNTFWGSFITNCRFGYCNIQLDMYQALNIHISGCYFSTPSTCCCMLDAARCISFVNCNFGCEKIEGSKFLNILTASSCTFTDCNFEVCYVNAASGAVNVQGGSVVTMNNCRFHRIKRASSFTGNCNIFYVAGANAVNLTLINCVFYDNGDGKNYRLYYFFVHAEHHRVYLSGNRKTIEGLADSSFNVADVYAPEMSVFQEITTKTLGT